MEGRRKQAQRDMSACEGDKEARKSIDITAANGWYEGGNGEVQRVCMCVSMRGREGGNGGRE